MTTLFALLALLSPVALVAGLIQPSWVLPWSKTKTRGRAALTYWISTIVFLILTGITAPETSTQQATAPSPPTEPVSPSPSQTSPSPVPTEATVVQPSTTVVSVGDGDTIRVKRNGEGISVRLACTDAAEKAQSPWGGMATAKLKELLPVGQAVELRVADTDRYGRTIAEVFKDGSSVNLQMVKSGQAVVYRQYLSACTSTQDQYLRAEAQAKAQRLGFWEQAAPIMPWDYRHGKVAKSSKPVTPTSRPVSKPTLSTPSPEPSVASTSKTSTTQSSTSSSSKGDYDCSDFSTQADAQKYLLPGDPYKLDREGDGAACESLP